LKRRRHLGLREKNTQDTKHPCDCFYANHQTPNRRPSQTDQRTPIRPHLLSYPPALDIDQIGSPSFANVLTNNLTPEETNKLKRARKAIYSFSRILKFILKVAVESDNDLSPTVLKPISADILELIKEILNPTPECSINLSEQDLYDIIFSK